MAETMKECQTQVTLQNPFSYMFRNLEYIPELLLFPKCSSFLYKMQRPLHLCPFLTNGSNPQKDLDKKKQIRSCNVIVWR